MCYGPKEPDFTKKNIPEPSCGDFDLDPVTTGILCFWSKDQDLDPHCSIQMFAILAKHQFFWAKNVIWICIT